MSSRDGRAGWRDLGPQADVCKHHPKAHKSGRRRKEFPIVAKVIESPYSLHTGHSYSYM